MIKIVAISDTHGSHLDLKVPDGDILVHCGDVCSHGSMIDAMAFMRWFNIHPHPHKIFIAGNHDWIFEKDPSLIRLILKEFPDLIYLEDSGCKIMGLKIWGSPVQPRFFNWAFNRDRGENIKRHWDMIPPDTDVLITHGPPFGLCDETYNHDFYAIDRVGCKDLLNTVKKIKPKLHLFGHIHYGYGHKHMDNSLFVNASMLDEDYALVNKPIVVDISENIAKIV